MSTDKPVGEDESGRAEVRGARERLAEIEGQLRTVNAQLDSARNADLCALRTQTARLASARAEAHEALGRALFEQFRRDLLAVGQPFDDGSVTPELVARAAYIRRACVSLLAPWPAIAAEAQEKFPVAQMRGPRHLQG
jgi:hypothetical protein